MSDTTEMVRLIRQAADMLEEELETVSTSRAAAMAFAESMLRMVAACMEPESEPALAAVDRVRALAKKEDLYVRVDELLEALDGAEERSR